MTTPSIDFNKLKENIKDKNFEASRKDLIQKEENAEDGGKNKAKEHWDIAKNNSDKFSSRVKF